MDGEKIPNVEEIRSQTNVDENVFNFLGELKIEGPDDLVILKNKILNSLEFRPYNDSTKNHADSIQWARTASEIIEDSYVYVGKACSDLAVVFLTVCKALGAEGRLVKLKSDDNTHSIVEIKIKGDWYMFDPSSADNLPPVKGEMDSESVWNGEYRLYKKGRDVWDMGLVSISSEENIFKE